MRHKSITVRSAALGCAIAVVIVGSPVPASASHALWPGSTITYFNAADAYRWQVSRSVRAWNESDVGIRFVKAASKASAQLVIRTTDKLGPASGYATVGYSPNAEVQLASPRSRPSHVDKWDMARAAAHELGHVLGLVHEPEVCSIMNFGGSLCDPPPTGKWRCRLTEAIDIRRVASRYGGSGAPVRRPATCYKWPIPKPATDLTAEVSPGGGGREVRVRWRNPTSKGLFRVIVNRAKGRCPDSHRDREAAVVDEQSRDAFHDDVPRGKLDSTIDSMIDSAAGNFCYRVWTGEEAGRYGTRGPRVWVELPDTSPPPPPPANDDFANATVMWDLPFSVLMDLGSSTSEPGEPVPSCSSSGRTVWLAYGSDVAQTLIADTVGTEGSASTRIAVFAGTTLDTLTEVACDAEADGLQARVTVDALAGQAYYFLVSVDDLDKSVPVRFNVKRSP